MQSTAKTVQEYHKELPPERREIVAAVRELILKNLPKGYLGKKDVLLPYISLASQKNYFSLYTYERLR